MAAWFGSISAFFTSLLGALKNLLLAPVYVIEMVASASGVVSEVLSYMPTELFAFAAAAVGICILYLILDR